MMTKLTVSNASLEGLSFAVGPFACNFSLLWDPLSREALAIDPGGESDKILHEIESRHLTLKGILHTHAHFDHVGASSILHQKTKAPLGLHPADDFLWKNVKMQGAFFSLPLENPDAYQCTLSDEISFSLGSNTLTCLHTPGHTPGSMCFVVDNLLFSGDTLFRESIGRSDLWGGDAALLARSIKNRLYTLDPDTQVVCGHGPQTEIGYERKYNPFVTA